MTNAISKSQQNEIKLLLSQNKTYAEIMERIPGLKKSTLGRYANKFYPNRVPATSGRKTIATTTTKSYIRRQVIKGAFKTTKAVYQYLSEVEYSISYSATLKLLKSMNFQAKVKVKKPLLKKSHKERRLAWAIAHKDWTSDDWRRMVFSDETKVNVFGSDGCKYYWSRPNDSLQPHHLDLTVKGGNGSVMNRANRA
ncbi:hypothetical protein G6F70_009214 [Rhizopus microsporus]|nr:hypothetical protein G6F70_009214 [Rhizopus microsporus]KAG1205903.1 hypothetical protein G6F69_009200 [Rhizopus microsporus]